MSKKQPKVALVMDWLTNVGGAEQVLLSIHKLYPDAPIYTSQYNPKGIDWFKDADVRTGWMKIFPSRLRRFLPVFRRLYFKHLDLSEYDLIISVTGAEAKGIKKGNATHLCYCHVPTQYYWQMYDQYVKNPGFGILSPLVRLAFKLLVKPLRKADYKAAQQPDQFITISTYAAEQIKKYYGRESVVIPPPVAVEDFSPSNDHRRSRTERTLMFDTEATPGGRSQTYGSDEAVAEGIFETPPLVTTARQVTWKRLDLAIQACLQTGQPLKIVGEGPEHKNLQKLAAGSELIKFYPVTDRTGIKRQLASSRGYIFPSMEPFGIAPVEALAAGIPVIAYQEGGSRDFIQDGVNGIFFQEQTVASLAQAIKKFNQTKFNPAKVSKSADQFSEQNFQSQMRKIIKQNIS